MSTLRAKLYRCREEAASLKDAASREKLAADALRAENDSLRDALTLAVYAVTRDGPLYRELTDAEIIAVIQKELVRIGVLK